MIVVIITVYDYYNTGVVSWGRLLYNRDSWLHKWTTVFLLGFFYVHIQSKLLLWTHTPVINWVVCLGQMVSS